MNARNPTQGWFESLRGGDTESAVQALREGRAESPREWPRLAVESGVVDSKGEYYERLRETALTATRETVRKHERADDNQLVHAVRAMDDCRRVANELTERVAEWAGTYDADATVDVEYVRTIASETHPGETDEVSESGTEDLHPILGEDSAPAGTHIRSLAQRVVELDEEATALRTFIERSTPAVAPNLAALAGPVLAARLVGLAGGLEELAKKPAGTVQVLGAEDALFAHLKGGAPSPKHGIIYTHDAVRNAPRGHRGSAARALAGKLTIAARIDHYSGEHRPELERELEERIERIHARDAE